MDWEHAFILHRRLYRETSLLLDVFTENNGRISVLARGVCKLRSSLKGILQPFTPLLVRWQGKVGGLRLLKNVEAISLTLPLSARSLYAGFYINELLVRLLEQETSYNDLFLSYLRCLKCLAQNKSDAVDPLLRKFELILLKNLGYGFDFLHCACSGDTVIDEMTYRYCEQQGFVASPIIDRLSFTGRELKALSARFFPDVQTLVAAKRFTQIAIRSYLGNKPLKSWELLS